MLLPNASARSVELRCARSAISAACSASSTMREIFSRQVTCRPSCATTTSHWQLICAKRTVCVMRTGTSRAPARWRLGSTRLSSEPGFSSKQVGHEKCSPALTATYQHRGVTPLASQLMPGVWPMDGYEHWPRISSVGELLRPGPAVSARQIRRACMHRSLAHCGKVAPPSL